MALQDKLKDSKLSLEGNGFDPQLRTPSWGYKNSAITAPALNPLDPILSGLQNTFDVDGNPKVSVVNFNKSTTPNYLPKESNLDELDPSDLSPKNKQVGTKTSVVSKIYKSAPGKKYRDLGPKDGRFTTS
jgi:hypothetical protein